MQAVPDLLQLPFPRPVCHSHRVQLEGFLLLPFNFLVVFGQDILLLELRQGRQERLGLKNESHGKEEAWLTQGKLRWLGILARHLWLSERASFKRAGGKLRFELKEGTWKL